MLKKKYEIFINRRVKICIYITFLDNTTQLTVKELISLHRTSTSASHITSPVLPLNFATLRFTKFMAAFLGFAQLKKNNF